MKKKQQQNHSVFWFSLLSISDLVTSKNQPLKFEKRRPATNQHHGFTFKSYDCLFVFWWDQQLNMLKFIMVLRKILLKLYLTLDLKKLHHLQRTPSTHHFPERKTLQLHLKTDLKYIDRKMEKQIWRNGSENEKTF